MLNNFQWYTKVINKPLSSSNWAGYLSRYTVGGYPVQVSTESQATPSKMCNIYQSVQIPGKSKIYHRGFQPHPFHLTQFNSLLISLDDKYQSWHIAIKYIKNQQSLLKKTCETST
jgi:hypothetical protein